MTANFVITGADKYRNCELAGKSCQW